MLDGISTHFNLISKAGSFGAKIFALGMTGFGIKRLWSQEAQQKYSLPTRVAFAGAYVLHVGSTSIATAALFGVSPVSAPVATAMVGATSLLTSYVNWIQTRVSHSISHKKLTTLEGELKKHHLDLTRSLVLIQSITDNEIQIKKLQDEIEWLKALQQQVQNTKRLRGQKRKETLKECYLNIEKKYEEKRKQNEIIDEYFKKVDIDSFQPETALKEIHQKIAHSQEEIEKLKLAQSQYTLPKTLSRLKRNQTSEEETLKKWGIINVQCIRYKKIADTIYQLKLHLQQLAKTDNLQVKMEKQFFEDRIQNLQFTLKYLIQPNEEIIDLEIGLTVILDDKIAESPIAFTHWLDGSLKEKIGLLDSQIKEQQENAKKMQICFNLFIKEPATTVDGHFIHIRQITLEIQELKNKLLAEEQDERSNRKKIDFSSVTSVLALSLCCLPSNGAIMKPLMLGVGLLSSASSLKDFYQKNLLLEKRKVHTQNQIQRLNKDLAFKTVAHAKTDLAHLRHDSPEKTILNLGVVQKALEQESQPIEPEEVKLPARRAKREAKKGITNCYHLEKGKRVKRNAPNDQKKTTIHIPRRSRYQ